VPPRINWLAEYSVHNQIIDDQHKYLFDLCNTLYNLVEQPVTTQSAKQILIGLTDYVEIHFSEEEKHYKNHPLFADHIELHQDFVKQINGYISDYNKGTLKLIDLADFIGDWLTDHITVIDSQYFRDVTSTDKE
jgi:hemerythrin